MMVLKKPEKWINTLREDGYAITDVIRTVIDVFLQSTHPLTAEEVVTRSLELRPETGRASVYRTIDKLEQSSLIQRVHDHHGDRCSSYIPILDGYDTLFSCHHCNRVLFLNSGGAFAGIKTQLAHDNQVKIDQGMIQLCGICPDCQNHHRH